MTHQIAVDTDVVAPESGDAPAHVIAPDIAYQRLLMVNVVFVGQPVAEGGDGRWVLVDAGLPTTAGRIRRAAEERFGKGTAPEAIILTHGHFDHIGALHSLLDDWPVPVYAHELERPFLDGTQSYPPPDPSVGGGLMALTSPLFPNGPFDFSHSLRALPADGSVPGLNGWRWLYTPGHAPGHISLWRERDRALIAGDAFITTRQESAYSVMTQAVEIHGPPTYYTPDWLSAAASVRQLAELEPSLAVTGHGRAVSGPEMLAALHLLADNFEAIAVPEHGRYVPSVSGSRHSDVSDEGAK